MVIWGSAHTRWIAAVTVLLIMLYAWTAQEHKFTLAEPEKTQDSQADTLLMNVVRKEFNTQGKINTVITSPEIKVFETPSYSQISKPELKTFNSQQLHWTIRSEQAKLSNNNTIELMNNVIAQNSIDVSVIKSDYIHVEQDSQNISTDQAVSLIQPNATLNAIGLSGNLKTHYLLLKSQVKGQYYDVK